MTASRPAPLASWSSGTTRLRGKHSTLRIHSWLPHGALNGSNGWTHNLEAREFANDTARLYLLREFNTDVLELFQSEFTNSDVTCSKALERLKAFCRAAFLRK